MFAGGGPIAAAMSHGCGAKCGAGRCDWQTGTCICDDGFAGVRCQGNCLASNSTLGLSEDGMTCACNDGYAGEFCEGNCSEHSAGGVSADGMTCTNCTDDYVGAFCQWPPAYTLSGCAVASHCGASPW